MAENLTKRKKVIWLIIILIIILIIAALIYLLYNYFGAAPPEKEVNLNENLNQAPVVEEPPVIPDFNKADLNVLADLKALSEEEIINEEAGVDVLFVAQSFAERFGSYSNQSDYRNFDDLEVFMTDSMNDWILKYKEELKKENPGIDTYYAVETKAISSEFTELDEEAGTAEVIIKTQRQEFENDITNPRIFYQDILLQLVKVDDQWKVKGAYWQ